MLPRPGGVRMELAVRDAGELSRGRVIYALGLLLLVAVMNVCDRTIMAVLAVDIRADLGLDNRQVGLLLGPAFAIVHLVAGLPIARLADRVSRRAVIALGLVGWSAMTALCGLASGFRPLLMARMGVGIGEAAGSPPSHSLISDYLPPARRALGLSLITIGATLGTGLGLVAGGWISDRWGWRTAFIAAGLPGFALAALVWLSLREPPRGHSEGRGRAIENDSWLDVLRYLLRTPSYVWMVAGMSGSGIYVLSKQLWEPTFLREVYGMGAAAAGGSYFLIASIPALVGITLGGWLTDRLGARDERWYLGMPALTNALGVPLAVAFLLWPEHHRIAGIPVAFGFSVIASVVFGASSPGIMALGQNLARPHMRAFSAALWSMVFTLVSMSLGPLLIGDLSTRLASSQGFDSLRWALVAATLAPLSGSLFQLIGMRTLRADLARARE
jgi:MFS family permease